MGEILLKVGDTSNWKRVVAWDKTAPRHKKYTMECIKCGYTTQTSIKSFTNSCKRCSSHRLGNNLRTTEETMWKRYKLRAKKDGILFDVSQEAFSKVLHDNCYYCGQEPSQTLKLGRLTDNTLIYNGVDRKENSAGYTDNNIVAACWKCNQAKKNYSLDEWKRMVKMWSERVDDW